jgi:hypothetical protein
MSTPIEMLTASPPETFDVMDRVMRRWVDVQGAVAAVLCVLDGEPDEATIETMRRYLTTDLDGMSAALDSAWEFFVAKGETGEASQ